MMGNKLIFHILLFLSSLLPLSVSESVSSRYPTFPLTKNSSCLDKCGNVTIPFPFGIGADCFLDEWYEILCNKSVPRLRKLDLEVRNISFPPSYSYESSYERSTITVNYPVVHSNSSCAPTHQASREPVAFHGSPFSFSRTDNIFVAVGCQNFAILKGSNHSFAGCGTDCRGNNTWRYSSCDGFDCCQSTIPDLLQGFSIYFLGEKISGTSAGDHDCQFAFLVNSLWFKPNSTDLYAIRDGDYVPVVLEWGIVDAAFLMSTGLIPQSEYESRRQYFLEHQGAGMGYSSSPRGTTCVMSGIINMKATLFMNCYCDSGFYGDPYIEDGCKDINECEIPNDDGSKRCGSLRKCTNTRGSYHCSNTTLFIIVGLCVSPAIGSFLFIFLPWCTCNLIKKRREAKLKAMFLRRIFQAWQLSSTKGSGEKGRLFNSKELEKATDHFNQDRVLGKGGQGTVYKGMLTDGTIVAVKKSIALDEENVEPIINEVVILSQINHRNVVKLLGCCLQREVPLLVYEFIPNGTLYQYIHNLEFHVSWEARLRIATEVAGALSYLHSSASIPIYHRDIKSSNILLDQQYRAKIADFGTSRIVALDRTHLTTLVQGTFGYLDPEYYQSSQFTEKSDVYSFGVVLVELLTGQKPICLLRAAEGRNLATYFIISMEENHLFDILDATIQEHGRAEEIAAVANLARWCLKPKGRERPTMREVVMELEGIRNLGLRSTKIEGNQETKRDHIEVETDGEMDAVFAMRGWETESDVTPLSNAHQFFT